MVIRPMTAAYASGEIGRPASGLGGKSGPAVLFSNVKDLVSLGSRPAAAGLYSAPAMFKIMGAVELMSEEAESLDDAGLFGDTQFLI